MAVDQSGNLWTADANLGNVDEFGPTGAFLQQWSDPSGPPIAIAVDSIDGGVYLVNGDGTTQMFRLVGNAGAVVDGGVVWGAVA